MGQIVGGAAKPKRCNLQSLSSLGTPAAGEYILVSSDNSMNAAGQGNFDCYIVGDGQKSATALTIHYIADAIFSKSSKNAVSGKAMADFLSQFFNFDDNTTFNISDKDGNVICRVDSDGIHTTNANIRTLSNNGKSLYVVDDNGNVVAKISAAGIECTKVTSERFERTDGKPLDAKYTNYELFTIGDSLSAGNYWPAKCAEKLGCKFNAEANTKAGQNISTGGTGTGGGGLNSAFFRVKNLYEQGIVENDGENAIIILENVNDISGGVTGTIEDVPLIPKTPIETGVIVEDFSASTLANIPSAERELSACLTLLRDSMGTRLTITSVPTTEGDITISTGWAGVGLQSYGIHVVPQSTQEETMAYCIARILEYNYTGVNVIDGGDGHSVIFSAGVSSPYYTFLEFADSGNTGMTCSLSSSDSVAAYVQETRFFVGTTLADWEDVSKWMQGNYLNKYRAWKSCIEYLINKFPKAHVIITGFGDMKCVHSSFVRYDGMPDQDAFNDSQVMTKNRAFWAFLRELSEYYGIPYIPVGEECGINIVNISTYYPDNNIHPNPLGFERMAELVARNIEKFV